jgi:hypothetical protein
MGDCGEDYSAHKQLAIERKKANLEKNKAHMISCGLSYSVDSSGSMHFETDKGKVIFYPTTNKYQHRGRVMYGPAARCEKYIRSLFT